MEVVVWAHNYAQKNKIKMKDVEESIKRIFYNNDVGFSSED